MNQIFGRMAASMILVMSLLAFGASGGSAQEQYTEEKLHSFVTAAISVNDLVQEWGPRIGAAESEQEAADLREQANAELRAAIEATPGITVEEYQEIGQAAQADPELSTKIQDIYAERSTE